jgi:exodeoxyribonuclease V alpha subunit
VDLFDRPVRGGSGKDEPQETVVEGTVDRLVFAGRDGEFTVARLRVEGESELVTIVGALPGIPVGARVRVRGTFEENPRFGRQLRVAAYTEVAPQTLEGLRRYLGSGLIKGIGPEFASRIVEKFGMRTLEVLDKEPYRISEVTGIGRGRADAIRRAWGDQQGVREVMVFLQGHGVSPAYAARIFKRYGVAAVARVRENPYRLAFDVWGIGFVSADRLAQELGIARDSEVRVAAGLRHVLGEAAGKGHVFLPRATLEEQAAVKLEVDAALVRPQVDALAQAGEVALESDVDLGELAYDRALYRCERAIARELLRLRDEPTARPVSGNVDQAIGRYEAAAEIALARAQREAIARALTEKVVVVTGGPGVGKTTIVRGVVDIARASHMTVALAAPTGRAAKRMSEATGQPAGTLHRLLEWRPADGSFGRNAGRPLEADLVIVDEASMIDVRLGADLFTALAPGTRLLLVGDVDQLPSVGPGSVLKDIIASRAVPTVRLTEIFRQAAKSLIVTNAHRINAGALPDLGSAPGSGRDERDFFVLEEEDPVKAAAVVRDLVVERLPRAYGLATHDIQVLVPMHRGDLGAQRLNELLQDALTRDAPEARRGGRVFRQGDRVMQLRNNYDKDVFNGDTGRITAIGDDLVQVRFDDRELEYESDDLDELGLAYATTVHKAQGSEYPAVVVPLHTQHYVMLQRNLLYTAVTRGRRLVVLVGTRKAVGIAVRNGDAGTRFSRLAARLAGA